MEIEIREYLKDELKRLNRMNDLLEKDINTGKLNVEPERIISNVKTILYSILSSYELVRMVFCKPGNLASVSCKAISSLVMLSPPFWCSGSR